MNNYEALTALTAYPLPADTLKGILLERGINGDEQADYTSTAFRGAKADILMWVSLAPNISEQGVNITFTAEARNMLRKQAMAIYNKIGEGEDNPTATQEYGYIGESF